jgi:hypothetical protein
VAADTGPRYASNGPETMLGGLPEAVGVGGDPDPQAGTKAARKNA